MKVLQVNAVYNYSSTGRTTAEIHHTLKECGIDSFVACSRINNTDGYVYHIGSEADIKIHGLMSRISGMQGYFSYFATKKLLRYMDSLNPDIVHLRILHANYINLPLLLKYLADKKIAVVITLHDCWFFTGKCCHYIDDNCYKWKEGCGNCPRLKNDNVSWFFDRTKKLWRDKRDLFFRIDRLGVIGVSDWTTNQAKQSFLSSAKIVKRIYNWIDSDVFKPKDTNHLRSAMKLQNNFVILGVASGWSEKKGLSQFIKMADHIGSQDRIILIGNMKQKVGLPNNIIHIEQTDDIEQLAEYYSMADVFVQLSLTETFGKVTAEALSCGTPAIVYNATANPELIGEGCGYIAEKNDLSQVIEHIMQVKKNRKSFYSEKCIKYAKANFDKTKNIKEHIDMYNELYKLDRKIC